MLRHQMPEVKDTCHKAGWEKVKAVKNAEKQGKYKSDMRAEMIVSCFFRIQNVVNANKCQNEKWQIIYKHDLLMCVIKTACCHIQKSRGSAGKVGKALLEDPIIKKGTSHKDSQDRVSLDEICSTYTWKKIGDKNIRAHKSIIGQGEEIGSATQPCEIREKPACGIKLLSHIISNGQVLGIPVDSGTKIGTGGNQKPDQKKRESK